MPQALQKMRIWQYAIITAMLMGGMMGCIGPKTSSSNNSNATAPSTTTATSSSNQSQEDPVRFGVLAIDSATSVSERYRLLVEYLSEETDRSFELVPVSQASQFTEVEAGNLDFTANNPLAAVQIQRLYDTDFLVTHVRPNTGTSFSGLIIVRNDSDIKTLEDLRGKKVSCVAFQTAAAGCVFQTYHLLQAGIDPFQAFASFTENKSQDNIVLSVLNKSIDAGFIRTGQLEKMVGKGLINNLTEIRVLDPMADDFPFVHTTALYPEWPIAALEDTDAELVEDVQAALLDLPSDHPAFTLLNVTGFVPAVDYSKVEALIQTLELRSWDVATEK